MLIRLHSGAYITIVEHEYYNQSVPALWTWHAIMTENARSYSQLLTPDFKPLLLLLLSHFSRVRLCTTPQMAAHQAPLSLGFSRQEYWSGLPFPSPMHACMLSHFSLVQLCSTPWTAAHQAPLSTGFSRQEYWSGLPLLSPSSLIYRMKICILIRFPQFEKLEKFEKPWFRIYCPFYSLLCHLLTCKDDFQDCPHSILTPPPCTACAHVHTHTHTHQFRTSKPRVTDSHEDKFLPLCLLPTSTAAAKLRQ